MTTAVDTPTITVNQAITIASDDAIPMYGAERLNRLQLTATLHDDGWHVEWHQWRPRHTGGGPHYVIDATTGSIVSKKYSQ
jgi:hypothetical protein